MLYPLQEELFSFSMLLSAVFVLWRCLIHGLISSRSLPQRQTQLQYCQGQGHGTSPANKSDNGCREIVTSLGKLGIIMAYFFLCDRYSLDLYAYPF